VRIGLRTLLGAHAGLEIVGECGTAAAAVAETERLQPDVVLLDVRLPDASGFDACRKIQQSGTEARVLILTSVATNETVFEAIEAGADGYLLKEIDAAGLVEAVQRVAAGQSILDPAVTRQVLARVRSLSAVAAQNQLGSLSAQESRVLTLVAKGRTNKEIASEMGISDKTVRNYLRHVFEKLGLSRRSQAAAFFAQHSGT
jgi:DNA-binding NarL/FixJ family response regulator